MRLRMTENCWPGFDHVFLREPDGVWVCQVCGEVAVKRLAAVRRNRYGAHFLCHLLARRSGNMFALLMILPVIFCTVF